MSGLLHILFPSYDDAKRFAPYELLRIATEGFSQMGTSYRLYLLGLLPVSVLHPHAIEVNLREF